MIVNFKKWRKILAHYLEANSLPHAGKAKGEAGWVTNSFKPFGKPARHVVIRVCNHLEAEKKITHKENNGTLNTAVQHALLPPPPKPTIGQTMVKLALKEVGTTEDPFGSNRGRRVEYYQSSTGAYGEAWCASFCSKMARNAGYKGTVSAGAWNLTDSHGTHVLGLAKAQPGDCVSLNEGSGHVGILESVQMDEGTVILIAGNTANSVQVHKYPISMIHSICRLEN